MSRTSKLLAILYIIFVIFSFIFVKSTLKEEEVIERKEDKKQTEDVYDFNAVLIYDNGKEIKELKEKMRNTDTILEFLKELRDHGKLIYEKTDYTYGIQIDSVNKIIPSDNYVWSIFLNGEDVTKDIGKIRVQKNVTLELKIIEKK